MDIHTGTYSGVTQGKTRIVTLDTGMKLKKKLNNPILFTAFLGPGLLGFICANYIINKLDMIQIGCVESDFILPGVIYNEEGLRHPFRLSPIQKVIFVVLVCEAPIMIQGMRSVLDTIMEWALKNKVKEIFVLDGFPVEGSPMSRGEPMVFSGIGGKLDKATPVHKNKDLRTKKEQNEKVSGVKSVYHPLSFITGMSGGILSGCLLNNIPFKSLIISTPIGKSDLEGAAIIIDSLNKLTDNKHLKIDSKELKEEAAILNYKIHYTPRHDSLD